jgi:MoaA/NifB/PqqE/SkfB family radical SAM enzyme
VSPCCTLWYEKFDFGNIKDSSFKEIWNGEKYQKARRLSRGDHISIYGHICYICKQNNAQI